MIGTMEESKTLDEALHFNATNIFEYIDKLHCDANTAIIGTNAEIAMSKVYEYIKTLQLPDTEKILFDIEDMSNHAIFENAHYAYRAGFIEACRLLKTLQSF